MTEQSDCLLITGFLSSIVLLGSVGCGKLLQDMFLELLAYPLGIPS